MGLVRYAGFDPNENQFDGVGLAPLHPEELRAYRRTRINVTRAWELKNSGLGWAKIGRQLAKEDGRAMPYLGTSVYIAANYATPPQERQENADG